LRKDSVNKLERVLDSIASLNINDDSEINRFISEARKHISDAQALELALTNIVSEINRELEEITEESIFDTKVVPKKSENDNIKLENIIDESVF